MSNIVICGDSFNVGIGCHDLKNDPYGSLLAKKLDKNLINLAKGSSTNLSIFLQVKYVVENVRDIEFVCVSPTSNNRVEWFSENSDPNRPPLSNTMVNYHQYPPYGEFSYKTLLENPMAKDPRYTGEILTENYYGIITYVDDVLSKKVPGGGYFEKFRNEPNEKMILLRNFYQYVFDDRIQRQYDIGVITLSHLLLKNNGIKHFILTDDPEYNTYIPEENVVYVSWGNLARDYPDDLPSLHTSKEGQRIVYESIMKKLGEDII